MKLSTWRMSPPHRLGLSSGREYRHEGTSTFGTPTIANTFGCEPERMISSTDLNDAGSRGFVRLTLFARRWFYFILFSKFSMPKRPIWPDYKLIISCWVSLCIWCDQPTFYQSLSSVVCCCMLAPGGRFAVTVDNLSTFGDWITMPTISVE